MTNQLRPIGMTAGNNKYGFTECPMCGRGPERSELSSYNDGNFMFRDGLSAKEYKISGLCQDCQDNVFQGE